MRSSSFVLWTAILLVSEIFAGDIKIAILPFTNTMEKLQHDPFSSEMHDNMLMPLSKSDEITLLERDEIQALMKEVALSQSGMVDDSKIVEYGRLKGVQYFLYGSFFQYEGQITLTVNLLTVNTATLGYSNSFQFPSSGIDEKMRGIANTIHVNLTGHPIPTKTTTKYIDKHTPRSDSAQAALAKQQKHESYMGWAIAIVVLGTVIAGVASWF